MTNYIYIYIIGCTINAGNAVDVHLFYIQEENTMRIVLDTDKKTITVPWNYQAKLDEINKIIAEANGNESKKKTSTGYIDDIWKYAIENSDKCVVTGSKPSKK